MCPYLPFMQCTVHQADLKLEKQAPRTHKNPMPSPAPDSAATYATVTGSPGVRPRLAGLVKKHDSALLYITEKSHLKPSVGSLVSLRAEASRAERCGDRFRCELRVLKDKRRGPGWTYGEVCRGPDGLC